MENARKKSLKGLVISNKMQDTIVVKVDRIIKHPLYKKLIRRNKKVRVHDKGNTCNVGDLVFIEETRPISKTKHWKLKQILEKAK